MFDNADARAVFCVDMGTTRTRVWLLQNRVVVSQVADDFGVRNVASGESRQWLSSRLVNLLERVLQLAVSNGLTEAPTAILAAGMITSEQGLRVVPHVRAPADEDTLKANLSIEHFAGYRGLPLIMVPGIRTVGYLSADGTLQGDVLRGEETLCIGLLRAKRLGPATALFNLGSHWKWISIDEQNRIAGSRTTLTGEVIHAVQTQTLIASSVFRELPSHFDGAWLDKGFAAAEQEGIGRALFSIRLMDQAGEGSPEQRLSFLYGAAMQNELGSLLRHFKRSVSSVLIAGHNDLAGHWSRYLAANGVMASTITQAEREAAYIDGLLALSSDAIHSLALDEREEPHLSASKAN
jgi:2-dehydro-3-deoxygalactonokinase